MREPSPQGQHVWLDDKTEVIVFRRDGELQIFNSLCPHMGAQLQCRNGGRELSCPWHGLNFSTVTLESDHHRYRRVKRFRGEYRDGILTVYYEKI